MFGALEDTICAPASGDTAAAIAVLRMSGPASIRLLERVFRRPSGGTADGRRSHRVWYGFIVDAQNRRLDEVLALVMRKPRTFTGEDVVEIHCHGGRVCRERILRRLVEAGARPAEAGEFTYRAFVSGRLGLAQAEALDGLIRAGSEISADAELYQVQGGIQRLVHDIREALVTQLARLEADLDFPEDDVPPATLTSIAGGLESLEGRIRALEATYAWGRLVREGVSVAIVGRPNVGKSSLMNALLRRERAIVSPHPGTTRDVVEDVMAFGGHRFLLRDTAGLRASSDEVESEGVARSLRAWRESDLCLLVVEGPSEDLSEDEEAWLAGASKEKTLVVLSKCDLGRRLPAQVLRGAAAIETSAVRVTGIRELAEAMVACVEAVRVQDAGGAFVTHERQRNRLARARGSLEAFRAALGQVPVDVAATHLYEAVEELGAITGEVAREEVLREIFATFCVGK